MGRQVDVCERERDEAEGDEAGNGNVREREMAYRGGSDVGAGDGLGDVFLLLALHLFRKATAGGREAEREVEGGRR